MPARTTKDNEQRSERTTICLCMIVKNEAKVIERCLESVKPVIDHWIIVDTGSTDGTQDIVRKAMSGIPGDLVEEDWVDFAHNRSQALSLSRGKADYSLIIDADDVLELPETFNDDRNSLSLNADGYNVNFSHDGSSYQRIQLVSNKLSWCYKGVLHEFIHCNSDKTNIHTLPWTIRYLADGRRHSTPSTYRNDANILEAALRNEKDAQLIARYTFYLAQSWRDCGENEKALEMYLERSKLGFWDEETYVSLLNAGRLQSSLGHDTEEVLKSFSLASATCPHRAEASHDAARLLRNLGRHEEGYAVAASADRTASVRPHASLFVENWIYDYGLKDELSVHAYHTGRYKECSMISVDLLARDCLPSDYRKRIAANAQFALERL